MKEFVGYEKLSKKKKREIDRLSRRDWGDVNPVTRRGEKPGVYVRCKQKTRIRLEMNKADSGFSITALIV